jgi:mono/diheme cytochrome c family protein
MGAQHSIRPWARGRRRAVLPTPRWSSVLGLRWVTVCLVLLAGCSQQMAEQPRHKPLDASTVFDDGRSARPLVPSTVARGQLRDDEQFYTGKLRGAPVDTLPFPVTREVLERGQVRFDIYCSPCHGRLGDGQGMVVQRGFTPPSSFHADRLREAPVGHLFDVISNGFGVMPDYAAQVLARDRWAIVAYIRALQLSQHTTLADVPPEARQQLTATGQ